ncbi:hypothetical protein FHS27_001179 [Rhodopirellula rubra]|uniref:Uncharacterized protein n=1 Tax=Aporhodopirellula rubra TaxID=980271 RepID=A0A7W5DVM8_9BACT|nr:hypothetical protein [Aporhodopirellula rubra]
MLKALILFGLVGFVVGVEYNLCGFGLWRF